VALPLHHLRTDRSMTSQLLRLVDNRTTIWICAGLTRPWRVASADLTYGEFDDLDDARAFCGLLIRGNPERYKAMGE
jgi:hypothetical protein